MRRRIESGDSPKSSVGDAATIERSDEPIVHSAMPDRTLRYVNPVANEDRASMRTTYPSCERRKCEDEVHASAHGEWMIRRKIATRLQSAAAKQQSE